MFGLRGLFALLLGDNAMPDDTAMMQQQMQMGGASNPQFDAKAAYKSEKLAINLIDYKFSIGDSDMRYLLSSATK